MKKTLVYISILLLVGTCLSPTIMGLVKDNPKIVKNITTETEYLDFEEHKNFQPMEELYKFYNLKYEKQFFNEELNEPIFCQGYWDYTIKGYITDETTSLPIEDANILIFSIGKHFSFDRVETTTDSTGYYEINLENIFYSEIIYFIRVEGYYSHYDNLLFYDNDIIWLNASLTPGAPAKNSVVNGYVYHADNADPIEGAVVDINWIDNNGHGDWLYAVTDESGFYSVDVSAGEVMPWVYADNYYETYKQETEIGDGETLEINIHLYPRYPDNAMICGYVTDEQSGDPIESVLIELMSDNYEIPHFDWNYTFTDAEGYYEIMVAESEFQITAFTYYHARYHSDNDYINEGETYEWDAILYEIPSQSAVITGYITDNNTNDPIDKAYIGCYWNDGQGHYYSKSTMSDNLGFYKINIAPGEISIHAHAGDYFYFDFEDYMIGEDEILLLDISLDPYPPKNSIVKGYVKSNTTTLPEIKGASISTSSYDENGEYCGGNYIKTDNSGFYEIAVPAGEVRLTVRADGHYYLFTDKYPIEEGETLQIDVVLEPVRLNINVEKPKGGIYLNNQRLIPFIFPIIIGDIDIEVNGSEELYEVEFYIDGKFKRADRFEPFTYKWDDKGFGFHKINLVCNGPYKEVVNKNIKVLKLF